MAKMSELAMVISDAYFRGISDIVVASQLGLSPEFVIEIYDQLEMDEIGDVNDEVYV